MNDSPFTIYPSLICLAFFALGAILGSFISLLIYRLYHDQKGIVSGRSQCPNCKKVLHWSELIPIISWVIQRGKCKKCGKPISPLYPLIETSFGLLLVSGIWHLISDKISTLELILIFLSLILFWYDVWFMTVDRRISFPSIGLAFLWIMINHPDQIGFHLLGGLLGGGVYAVQYFYSKGRWVGFGDLELGLFMGLILGPKMIWLALFAAYLLGCLWILFFTLYSLLFTGKIPDLKQKKLPMGAFLMPSLIVFILWGELIWEWYWNLILI